MNSVKKFNIISNLEIELCHEFLLYLNGKDIFKTGNIFKLPKAVMENEYFWRLKFKIDKLQLKRHQYSENFEIYQQNFRCTEKAFYSYLNKLRQNWLTKSWSDALNPIGSERREPYIKDADERFILKCASLTYEIANSTTNEIISKFKMRQTNLNEWKMRFPFVISYNWFHNKIYVWNAKENKLMWQKRFSRTLDASITAFCANDNIIAAMTSDKTQISLIDMSSGIIKANLPHANDVHSVYFCNKFLITTTNFDRALHVWDVNNQILKYSIERKFIIVLDDGNDNEYAILLEDKNIYSQVLNLEEGTLHEFETNLHYNYPIRSKIILRKSKVIFLDLDNNLNEVDCSTRACIAKKNFQIKIEMISANSNFIFVQTLGDIRIVEYETCRELRIFSPTKTIGGVEIKNNMLNFFKVLESKLILKYDPYDTECEYLWSQFTLDFNV